MQCMPQGRQQRARLVVQAQTQQQVAAEKVHQKDDEYNRQMAKQMHWDNPYEYHFDRGQSATSPASITVQEP